MEVPEGHLGDDGNLALARSAEEFGRSLVCNGERFLHLVEKRTMESVINGVGREIWERSVEAHESLIYMSEDATDIGDVLATEMAHAAVIAEDSYKEADIKRAEDENVGLEKNYARSDKVQKFRRTRRNSNRYEEYKLMFDAMIIDFRWHKIDIDLEEADLSVFKGTLPEDDDRKMILFASAAFQRGMYAILGGDDLFSKRFNELTNP